MNDESEVFLAVLARVAARGFTSAVVLVIQSVFTFPPIKCQQTLPETPWLRFSGKRMLWMEAFLVHTQSFLRLQKHHGLIKESALVFSTAILRYVRIKS